MSQKVDTMNEMLNKAELDRDKFMESAQNAEARYYEHSQNTEEEVL